MKKITSIAIILLSFTACVSSPRYIPQTMFPNGPILMEPKINHSFSTELHKFVELEFFNDNSEWVEIESFSLESSKEKPTEILQDQASLDEWVNVRAQEKVNRAGSRAESASFGFALLGIGVAIAEIASGSYHSDARTAAFIASDSFAIAAAVDEENTIQDIDKTLRNAPLSARIALPPGRSVTRWFVINTPDNALPSRFFIKYKATGRISGVEEVKNIELINDAPVLVTQEKTQKLKRPMKNDLWAEDL